METKLLDEIYSAIIKLQTGIPVDWMSLVLLGVIVLAASFGASYFGSYFSKKAEYRVIKKEISKITATVESIKTDYAKTLEMLSHYNRLKMAALDERLKAHQKAYSLWSELRRKVHKKDSEKTKTLIACQEWWEQNCLYLNEESRQAFISAIHAVALHSDLTEGQTPKEEVLENWEFINQCGEAIIKDAGLPSFGKDELNKLNKLNDRIHV